MASFEAQALLFLFTLLSTCFFYVSDSSLKLQQHIWANVYFWVDGFREKTGSSAEINKASWVLETFCAHYIGVLPRLEHFTLQSNSEVAPVNKQGTATNAAEYLKALQVATSSLMRPSCRLGEDEWSFAVMSTKRFQPSCHLCFSHFQWKSALECSYKKIVGINWIY